MKLYTRGQVVRRIIYGAGTAFILTAILFYNLGKNSDRVKKDSTQETAELIQAEPLADNSVLADSVPVAGGAVSYSQDENENISVYKTCNEAVVNINTKVTSYDWFWDPYVTDGGSGSGSIIDKRGYILTNVHVISGATKIYVSLYDGSQYEATVVGEDIDSDLAVIKFDPPAGVTLSTIPFGDSTKLKVGQKVIAIGNPFGMERTMTTGIVSGLGRPIQNSNDRIIRNMIQTDAAINPGNSGGPLLDTTGKMVGINTMIMSSSGSSSGVGFAVPSEIAVRVVNDLLKYGKVQRGAIDASIIQLTTRIAQYAGLDISSGMLVSEVEEGSNAEKAGLRGGTKAVYYGSRNNILYLGGDIITKIDGISITSLAEYYSALESKKPGDTVQVVVHRNKKDVTLKITLSE
ncbi:MAG: trypsin-like peptidase domain-containing protein [Treponema sp.]|nr:trypsin-like peptidase domain-containing protein [Treponema sp.]